MRRLALCWAALFAVMVPAFAQAPLKVAVFVDPPFVMHDDATGQYSGYSIDLWETIATKLGASFAYQPAASLAELMQRLQDNQADVGVTNLTITRSRLQRIDFTQPFFDSGLRLMINEEKSSAFGHVIDRLTDPAHLRVYGWIVGLILVATFGLTLFDRHFDKDFPRQWHVGLAESFYMVMSLITSGRAPHKALFGSLGKVFAAIWMISGVAVLAVVTSSVASVMTASALDSDITNFADLHGKSVGVLDGSYAQQFCRDAALPTTPYDNLEEAVQALVRKQIQVLVGDDALLEYYDNSHPELPITEVGEIFQPEKYGLALPKDSRLTRDVDLQILAAQESGYLQKLRAKYFGVVP